MSDASYNLSNESPRSPPHSVPTSPAPSSTAITAVDPPRPEIRPFRLTRVEEDQSPPRSPSDYPPVSPGTARTILTLIPDLDETLRATAFGLATTVYRRTEQYAIDLQESQERVAHLERVTAAREADNRQLRARLGLLGVPDGFERNQGRVAARVPTGDGQMVVPEWVRIVGDGTVELMAGRQPGEPTYVIELFLRPDYTEAPAETAAGWFLALLACRDGGFHTLVEAALRLNSPAAVAEIHRYRDLETERDELYAQQNHIADLLNSTRDRLDACRHRMEATHLPTCLRHLEHRNSFVPRIAPQLGRRRYANVLRNAPRTRADDGASA